MEHPKPSWRCREAKQRTERIDPDNPRRWDEPGERTYRRFVKEKCSRCGFKPKVPYQLDVDHIDGNWRNNSPDNLQTLCANCHRLKTYCQRFPEQATALGISW